MERGKKRGFSSHFGVGVAIEVHSGLVIDYEVLSNYCHGCAIMPLRKSGDLLNEWKQNHKLECQKNFEGSSGAMEVEAGIRIFSRSIDKYKFRYMCMLSDGDSKTFSKLTEMSIYGEKKEIQKLECVNHIQKRMGTALRKLVSEQKARKETISGKGKLTNALIDKLQTYYGLAIKRNPGEVDQMYSSIWATFLHMSSTDEDPRHKHCPQGEDSWCFYQKSVAKKNSQIAMTNIRICPGIYVLR